MKHTIESFLDSLPKEVLQQCVEAIKFYSQQYQDMIDDTDESKINAVLSVNNVIDELVKEDLEHTTPSCKKGCAHCCYLCIYITPDEALVILDYCKHKNIEIDWDRIEVQKDLTPETWIRQHTHISRCAFLNNDNGECTIYPVRPMACRKYYVVTDPDLCDTTTGKHEIAIMNNIETEIMVSSIHQLRTYGNLAAIMLKTKSNCEKNNSGDTTQA